MGERLVVDESMIKYKGRAISWVQYMAAKPIKHGIKVFALCCSYTGFLCAFEVYTGKEQEESGSPTQVVIRLLTMAGLIGGAQGVGRIIYCDNWYTSMDLVTALWTTFGFFCVGTYVLSKKKSRVGRDFPFAKLSGGEMSKIPRGWSRRATQIVEGTFNGAVAIMQGTMWRDKKMVGYLHTHKVEPTKSDTQVQRYDKATGQRIKINAPAVCADYSKYMNGVDRMDRDNADWSVSIRTNRWYLRVVFWILDCVIFAMYLVATFGEGEVAAKYKNKNNGRRKFQIDLAMALMEEGLTRDWKGDLKDDSGRPAWNRKRGYIPCNCEV